MTIESAGYSGKPLAEKLGMKDGQSALFIALPGSVYELAEAREFSTCEKAGWDSLPGDGHYDYVHAFTADYVALANNAEVFRHWITPDGMIWVSWPKKSSNVSTDITEDGIREVLLPAGLVDVKVCAVTDIWSGLKLVVRKELRRH